MRTQRLYSKRRLDIVHGNRRVGRPAVGAMGVASLEEAGRSREWECFIPATIPKRLVGVNDTRSIVAPRLVLT